MRRLIYLLFLSLPCFAQNTFVLTLPPSNGDGYQSTTTDSIIVSSQPTQGVLIQVTSLDPWIAFNCDASNNGASALETLTGNSINFCVNPALLTADGYYIGLIQVTAPNFAPFRVPVHLTKIPTGDLTAATDPTVLTPSQNTGTITVMADPNGQNNPSRSSSLPFTSAIDHPNPPEGNWLSINQLDTNTSGRVQVTADITKLKNQIPGQYTGTVQFTESGGNHDKTSVTVRFNVVAQDFGTTLGLPHIAANGNWITGLYVYNTGSQNAPFSISFYNKNGAPLPVPVAGVGTMFSYSDMIPANGLRYYELGDPNAGLIVGWGLIKSAPSVSVQALFRELAQGNYYEGAINVNAGGHEFLFPFDATTANTGDQVHLAFAIANLDPTNAASISCTANDSTGTPIANGFTVANGIPPLGHYSNTYDNLKGLKGTVNCTSTTAVVPLALRFLGGTALSSLPVTVK